MLSYKIDKKTFNQLISLQNKISEKSVFVSSLGKEARIAIQRYAFISNIGASTRIENAVLTNQEIEWIDSTLSEDGKTTAFEDQKKYIENKITKDKERSLEEVAGCREFLQFLFMSAKELKPFTEADLRQFHHVLLKYYPQASHYLGQYKTSHNSVISINNLTGEKKDVLRTADPGNETKIAMQDLIKWYREEIENHPWTIAVACELVFRFLAIHPFQDGNGRLGRGLFYLALMQSPFDSLSAIAPYLSLDRSIEENRQEYYFVLRQCSSGRFCVDPTEYKIENFLSFIITRLNDALEDVSLYHEKYSNYQKLSSNHKTVLQCFKERPETRLTVGDLIELLKQPRRTITYNLSQLTKKGFLQRTGSTRSSEYKLVF